MSTGWKFGRWSGMLMLGAAVLCAGTIPQAQAAPTQSHRKAKKKVPPPPLPSGPTGPVQQIPLDSIAAVPPQVSFQNNELTIVAPNSTLSDILRAVKKQTGAEIDVPAAPERVVTHLGPGPARDVLADLLNGSRFNYVLLGSPGNEAMLTRVVLVPKQTQQQMAASNAPEAQQAGNPPSPEQDASAQATDAEPADETATDESAEQPEQPEQAEQPAANPDQPNVKTPQQMLQEMQQRQMMMQQGQPGQAVPGSGMPPHPPQQQ